jgi:hypothetical protein
VTEGSDERAGSPARGPVAIDIEIDVADGPRLPVWRRLSSAHLFAVAMIVGSALWLSLWTVPNARLDSLEILVAWCTTSDSRAQLRPERCLVGDLVLARFSPWTRARADALHARAAYEAERRVLINAMRENERQGWGYALMVAEHDEQLEQLAALGLRASSLEFARDRLPSSSSSLPALDLPRDLVELGALRVAAEATFAELEAGRSVRWWVVHEAILTRGAHGRIGEVAKATAEHEDQPREQGIWLCLQGERELGAALLARAEANGPDPASVWARFGSVEHVIGALCRGERPQPERAPSSLRAWLAARAAARDPDALSWTVGSSAANLSILAQLIVRDEPTATALLDGLGVDATDPLPAYTRPFAFSPEAIVYDPTTLLRAAELTAARAVVPVGDADTPSRHPEAQLELLAASLAIAAGREFLRRAELERAREALAMADRHLPVEQRVDLAWLRLRAGEVEAVVELASGLRAAGSADGRELDERELAELGLLELEALTAGGQIDRARELIHALPVAPPEWHQAEIVPRLPILYQRWLLPFEPTMPIVLLLDGPLSPISPETGCAVLLDGSLHKHRTGALRHYMWHRADHARRCGDADEAAHWRARAAALLGLAKTEDDQLLLYALGI